MYTIVMVERYVVVHVHVNMGNDVCILLLWLNVTWLYMFIKLWETTSVHICYGWTYRGCTCPCKYGKRHVYTIVTVERNVVIHSHVNMGNDVCILLLRLNVTWLYVSM